jgi:uncharacterized protein (DUF433 family)
MERIVSKDGVMGGQPWIEGRRISVLQVVEWVHEEGMAPETVATEFDPDMADVHRALAYYYDHTDEMGGVASAPREANPGEPGASV